MKAEVEFRCPRCLKIVEVYTNQNARPHADTDGRACRGAGARAWSQIMAIEGAKEEPPAVVKVGQSRGNNGR